MHPNFLIFGVQIHAYSLFTVLALIFAAFGGYGFAVYSGFKKADAFWMIFLMSVRAFVGARVFNLIVNFSYYDDDFFKVFEFSTRGFSLYGGVLGAIVAGFLVSKFRKIQLMRFADIMTPITGLSIVLMRVGCFLNGCCFGKETDSVFGVVFPVLSPAHIHQLNGSLFGSSIVWPVLPTQLFELVFVLICVVFAFWGVKRKFWDGSVFLICGAFFSVFRWVNMYFRELNYTDLVIYYVYPAFYFSIICLCMGLLLFLNRKRFFN